MSVRTYVGHNVRELYGTYAKVVIAGTKDTSGQAENQSRTSKHLGKHSGKILDLYMR